jgi:hypothetical protein
VPSSVAVQDAKGNKKRQKWHPKWVADTADYDNDDDKKTGSSDMECIATTARSGKLQARPLTGHFERLLEGVCSNQAYPIKHKLNDYKMMKNFMTSGSLTRDKEPEEDPGRSDAMPFPREDAFMTVDDGRPPSERHRVSNLSPRTPTHCGWGPGNAGV